MSHINNTSSSHSPTITSTLVDYHESSPGKKGLLRIKNGRLILISHEKVSFIDRIKNFLGIHGYGLRSVLDWMQKQEKSIKKEILQNPENRAGFITLQEAIKQYNDELDSPQLRVVVRLVVQLFQKKIVETKWIDTILKDEGESSSIQQQGAHKPQEGKGISGPNPSDKENNSFIQQEIENKPQEPEETSRIEKTNVLAKEDGDDRPIAMNPLPGQKETSSVFIAEKDSEQSDNTTSDHIAQDMETNSSKTLQSLREKIQQQDPNVLSLGILREYTTLSLQLVCQHITDIECSYFEKQLIAAMQEASIAESNRELILQIATIVANQNPQNDSLIRVCEFFQNKFSIDTLSPQEQIFLATIHNTAGFVKSDWTKKLKLSLVIERVKKSVTTGVEGQSAKSKLDIKKIATLLLEQAPQNSSDQKNDDGSLDAIVLKRFRERLLEEIKLTDPISIHYSSKKHSSKNSPDIGQIVLIDNKGTLTYQRFFEVVQKNKEIGNLNTEIRALISHESIKRKRDNSTFRSEIEENIQKIIGKLFEDFEQFFESGEGIALPSIPVTLDEKNFEDVFISLAEIEGDVKNIKPSDPDRMEILQDIQNTISCLCSQLGYTVNQTLCKDNATSLCRYVQEYGQLPRTLHHMLAHPQNSKIAEALSHLIYYHIALQNEIKLGFHQIATLDDLEWLFKESSSEEKQKKCYELLKELKSDPRFNGRALTRQQALWGEEVANVLNPKPGKTPDPIYGPGGSGKTASVGFFVHLLPKWKIGQEGQNIILLSPFAQKQDEKDEHSLVHHMMLSQFSGSVILPVNFDPATTVVVIDEAHLLQPDFSLYLAGPDNKTRYIGSNYLKMTATPITAPMNSEERYTAICDTFEKQKGIVEEGITNIQTEIAKIEAERQAEEAKDNQKRKDQFSECLKALMRSVSPLLQKGLKIQQLSNVKYSLYLDAIFSPLCSNGSSQSFSQSPQSDFKSSQPKTTTKNKPAINTPSPHPEKSLQDSFDAFLRDKGFLENVAFWKEVGFAEAAKSDTKLQMIEVLQQLFKAYAASIGVGGYDSVFEKIFSEWSRGEKSLESIMFGYTVKTYFASKKEKYPIASKKGEDPNTVSPICSLPLSASNSYSARYTALQSKKRKLNEIRQTLQDRIKQLQEEIETAKKKETEEKNVYDATAQLRKTCLDSMDVKEQATISWDAESISSYVYEEFKTAHKIQVIVPFLKIKERHVDSILTSLESKFIGKKVHVVYHDSHSGVEKRGKDYRVSSAGVSTELDAAWLPSQDDVVVMLYDATNKQGGDFGHLSFNPSQALNEHLQIQQVIFLNVVDEKNPAHTCDTVTESDLYQALRRRRGDDTSGPKRHVVSPIKKDELQKKIGQQQHKFEQQWAMQNTLHRIACSHFDMTEKLQTIGKKDPISIPKKHSLSITDPAAEKTKTVYERFFTMQSSINTEHMTQEQILSKKITAMTSLESLQEDVDIHAIEDTLNSYMTIVEAMKMVEDVKPPVPKEDIVSSAK